MKETQIYLKGTIKISKPPKPLNLENRINKNPKHALAQPLVNYKSLFILKKLLILQIFLQWGLFK